MVRCFVFTNSGSRPVAAFLINTVCISQIPQGVKQLAAALLGRLVKSKPSRSVVATELNIEALVPAIADMINHGAEPLQLEAGETLNSLAADPTLVAAVCRVRARLETTLVYWVRGHREDDAKPKGRTGFGGSCTESLGSSWCALDIYVSSSLRMSRLQTHPITEKHFFPFFAEFLCHRLFPEACDCRAGGRGASAGAPFEPALGARGATGYPAFSLDHSDVRRQPSRSEGRGKRFRPGHHARARGVCREGGGCRRAYHACRVPRWAFVLVV